MAMPDWTPTDSTPTDADSPKGVRGWLQRRAEALLRKPGRALPALREPGDRQVVLQVRGAKPIPVITVICQATGLDFVSAQALAHDAPIVVVAGISEASANRVVERLHKAGAKAVVGEAYRPQ
jgi:ribosomal protein L7/L12